MKIKKEYKDIAIGSLVLDEENSTLLSKKVLENMIKDFETPIIICKGVDKPALVVGMVTRINKLENSIIYGNIAMFYDRINNQIDDDYECSLEVEIYESKKIMIGENLLATIVTDFKITGVNII